MDIGRPSRPPAAASRASTVCIAIVICACGVATAQSSGVTTPQRRRQKASQRERSWGKNEGDATKIQHEQVPALVQMWMQQFDRDGNGVLNADEVRGISDQSQTDNAGGEAGSSDQKLEGMMMMMDKNSDGIVTRKELLRFGRLMVDMDGRTDTLPSPTRPKTTPRKSHDGEYDAKDEL